MSNVLKPKRSWTANAVPTTSDLSSNEVAFNFADSKLFVRNPTTGNIVSVSLGGGGSSSIVTASTVAGFPATGTAGVLYVALDTSQVFQWQGAYLEVGAAGGSQWSSVPTSATATGSPGQTAYDANFQYTCVAANTWVRSPLSTWSFSPTSISGLAAWWDFSDPNNVTLNGSNISQVTDKSGAGRTATQSTSGNQPALTSNVLNGLSMATFNNSTSYMTYGTDLFTYTGAATVFVVCKDIVTEVNDYAAFLHEYRRARQSVVIHPMLYDASASRGFRPGLDSWAGQLYETSAAYGLPAQTSPSILQYYWQNWSTAHNDGATLIGVNNDSVPLTSKGSSAQSFSGAASQRQIGCAQGDGAIGYSSVLNGKVGEILVWTVALTATQRATVRSYLSTKWNIALS
jgi:hypothetical protein